MDIEVRIRGLMMDPIDKHADCGAEGCGFRCCDAYLGGHFEATRLRTRLRRSPPRAR